MCESQLCQGRCEMNVAVFRTQLTLASSALMFTAYEQLAMTATDNIATNKVTSLDVDMQGGLDQ